MVVVTVVVMLDGLANSEHVTIWMLHLHFAYIPGFIPRRTDDFEIFAHASGIHGIHIVSPDCQPRSIWAATALPVATQADCQFASAHSAEGWFASIRRPVPFAGPTELLKPYEAVEQIRHIQYRNQRINVHPALAGGDQAGVLSRLGATGISRDIHDQSAARSQDLMDAPFACGAAM